MTSLRTARTPLLLAVIALAVFAAVAIAAPDRTLVLGPGSLEQKWDGGPVTSTGFLAADDDDTLLDVKVDGTLKVDFAEVTTGDIDMKIYKSNAAGEANGDAVAEDISVEPQGPSAAQVKVTKGFWLVRAEGFPAANASYKGTAKLTPSAAAAPDPGATETPAPGGGGSGGSGGGTGTGGGTTTQPAPSDLAPEAKIGKLAKSSKSAKLKGFSGTASDDKGVAKVEIAVMAKKGAKCTQMKANGSFVKAAKCGAPTIFLAAKGTTSWTFKLKRKLKKGSYILLARATDTGGQKQAGFTPANNRAFKVK